MANFLTPPAHKPEMAEEKVNSSYNWLRWQVFIGIFIGYAGFYLVRKNFSLAMPHILAEGAFEKGDLGLAIAGSSVGYAFSKFLMGSVSDRSNARIFLPLGLVLAAVATIIQGTSFGTSSLAMMFIMQFLIGWFGGMGWPPCGRVMTHWFSVRERGTKMAIWNCAHNVGGALLGPITAFGIAAYGWQAGTFWLPAAVAIIIAVLAFFMLRDNPQSCGLPSVEKWRDDYPKNYSEKQETVLTTKEIFMKHVLNNKMLWFIALANAFVYMVRYGCLDWAPTYLQEHKGYSLDESGWAYFAYEFAAIPGTLVCGWLSDVVFKGRRAITTIIFMALVAVLVGIYWFNPAGHPMLDTACLIGIGFLIYGPVMLIGVQALDLAPKNAAGTAAGFTGFFGYFFGTALLAQIAVGYVVQEFGWDSYFIMMLAACAISIFFVSFTYKEEQYLIQNRKGTK